MYNRMRARAPSNVRFLRVLLLTPFAFMLAAPSWAQEGDRYVEEVIVTGTKRETSQQDTPLAVSTLTAQQIENTFISDIRAVAELTPNVLLTTQPAFNALSGGIRGTGSTSILVTQDTSVGITVDDFVISSVQSQFVEMFDLQQVEVYRGPQGTLFGKNSTGGVIAITTKRPDLENYGANIEFTYGQYDTPNGSSDIAKLSAAVDVPIIPGKLGLRIAGVMDTNDGYFKNDKNTATFPDVVPWFAAYGLPIIDPPVPPELDNPVRGDNRDLDDKDVLAVRSKLLWQPTDWYEAYFTWEYLRDDSGSPATVHESPEGEGFLHPLFGFPAIGGGDPYSTGMTTTAPVNNLDGHQVDSDGFYLTQTFGLENMDIKIISGYRETDETLPSTYTGEAFPLFDASRNLEREQTQIEGRVITNFDWPVNFVGGLAYFKDDVDFRGMSTQGFNMFFLAPDPTTGTFLRPDGYINMDTDWVTDPTLGLTQQERESYAAYLDGTWEVTEKISISAGIRYTEDDKEFLKYANGGGQCNEYTPEKDAVLADPTQPFDPLTNCAADVRSNALSRAGLTPAQYDPRIDYLGPEQYSTIENPDETFDEVTWRFVVDYNTFEDQMVYGSVSTGFVSGGFTETCSTSLTCQAYDSETNTNYEVGYKADLMDRTLRLNTAVFYTEYDDIQRNQVVPFVNASGNPAQETITVNAGESSAFGVEIEATWLATPNLTIRGGLGYLDAEYDDFKFDPQPNNPNVGVTDFESLDVPFASEWQASIDATYDWRLNNGHTISLNVNANYQDETETSPFDTNAAALDPVVIRHPTNTQIEERTLVNASVSWQDPDDRYYVMLYGRNLTDEHERVGANSVAFLWNFTYYGPPREYGLRVGVNLQ